MSRAAPWLAAPWLAALVLACVGVGCGKPVLRVADASLGDYYTEEEYQKLSKEAREEYCNELALQDSLYRDEIRGAAEALEALRLRQGAMGREADSLAAWADSLEARVARTRASAVARPVVAVTVRRGDSLWRISARATVYADGRRWRRIFEANRDRIRNPDLIYPGQELRIPQ
jgi:nucleoid-associated protein YgaU